MGNHVTTAQESAGDSLGVGSFQEPPTSVCGSLQRLGQAAHAPQNLAVLLQGGWE